MGVFGLNPTTKLRISGTGIPTIDGGTFSFSNPSIAYGNTEIFNLVAVTGLGAGAIQSISVAVLGVVTSKAHGLRTNDVVQFAVTGMLALNNNIGVTVTYIGVDTFSIGLMTTGYPAFTGGTWSLRYRNFTVAPIYATLTSPTDAITKANPAQVTHNAHGLSTGTVLDFFSMAGMTQLNGVRAQIRVVDANNFILNEIDSTLFGSFTGGTYTVVPEVEAVVDPTLMETVYYVETFVNSYGSEGPPSPTSNLVDIYDGDLSTLTSANVAADPIFAIVSKNIYRSNVDSNGTEQLQFLANIPLATTTYADTKLAASLGEILQSLLWDGAPDGVEGLITLPAQTMAAFSGNLVLFSEPLYPHAWPASYQQVTDTPVMGLASFGSAIIVLTQGTPYLVSGNTPSNNVMDKLGVGYGCVSKRSVVQAGGMVIYAGTDGLIAMGTSQTDILTKDLISPEQWRADYNPSTLSGFFWESKYVGFYNGNAGFIFDPKTGDFVALDFFASAGYHDPVTGALYLVVGPNIVAFVRGTQTRTMNMVTRRYRFKAASFSAAKIIAQAYPVTLQITYYSHDAAGNAVTTPATITATSSREFRLPDTGIIEECDITIENSLTAIYLAGSLAELPL